jgi:integrase
MLTDVSIKKLPRPEKRREIPDRGGTKGLHLVHQPSGAKSWALRYRFDGRPRKLTLGAYPDVPLAEARRRAEQARGEIAGRKDPAGAKRASKAAVKAAREADETTVAKVATSFVERYVKRHVGPSWGDEMERLFKVEINPKLGDKPLAAVTKPDVHDLLDGIVDRGAPVVANRTLAVFRRFFNWTIERGIIATSPCDRIKAPAPEASRDRVLSDDELRLAWRAFERVNWPFGRIAQLLLLTDARLSEIAEGRWSEIDLEARTWTIAKERSKNKIAHEIPLSDPAIAILKSMPRIGGKDAFIFSRSGRSAVTGFSNGKIALDAAVLEIMKTDAEARGENVESVIPPPHWTFHDLRRTAASGMAALGIAPHVVEAVLNHKNGTIRGVAAIYNKYSYAPEKRAALDAWARKLDAIVTGESASNVVALAKARGKGRPCQNTNTIRNRAPSRSSNT